MIYEYHLIATIPQLFQKCISGIQFSYFCELFVFKNMNIDSYCCITVGPKMSAVANGYS